MSVFRTPNQTPPVGPPSVLPQRNQAPGPNQTPSAHAPDPYLPDDSTVRWTVFNGRRIPVITPPPTGHRM